MKAVVPHSAMIDLFFTIIIIMMMAPIVLLCVIVFQIHAELCLDWSTVNCVVSWRKVNGLFHVLSFQLFCCHYISTYTAPCVCSHVTFFRWHMLSVAVCPLTILLIWCRTRGKETIQETILQQLESCGQFCGDGFISSEMCTCTFFLTHTACCIHGVCYWRCLKFSYTQLGFDWL